ncbi:MAG: hypothetical protein E3J54_04155 [Actinobacteria bacterium]|nr:MAG: hypothetical protein E3J54_04155 [Actinomycetota bacterium]
MAGVGNTPQDFTSTPLLENPSIRDSSSHSPESLVSLPITMVPVSPSISFAVTKPNLIAKPGVKSLFAIPLIPSVPKIISLIYSLLKKSMAIIAQITG